MRRWEFIILFSMLAATLVAPPQAWPQEAGRTYRLGVLLLTARSMEETREMTLAQLAKHGFVEGRNLIVDSRIGGPEQLPGFARELVGGKPEAILAVGTSAIRAAQAATATVPIVMMGDDPVGHGWAVSLARPGGNVTGVTILAAELDAKRLQLVHEAMPLARRVAALFRPPENREEIERAMRDVAVSAGLEFHAFDTASPADYPAAFAQMRKADAQALVITSNPQLYHDGAQLALLALQARLPTICQWADMARTGCLIGYGPSLREMRRGTGEYLARIFQGALPSALPIEGPTHFEFVINLKTARALGIEMPQGLLLRADEVIE